MLFRSVMLAAVVAGAWYYERAHSASPSQLAARTIIGSNLALGTDGNEALGTYLIGYTGAAVYTHDGDTASSSACYDACAQEWPPYLVGSEDNIHQLKAGVRDVTSTITRTDGSLQLTYDGHPLYFYAADKESNNPSGNGVSGAWHLVRP